MNELNIDDTKDFLSSDEAFEVPVQIGPGPQKMISLDNGLTYHMPADLDPIELERRWNAVANALPGSWQKRARLSYCFEESLDTLSVSSNAKRWKAFDAVLFLEIYLKYADKSLTVDNS